MCVANSVTSQTIGVIKFSKQSLIELKIVCFLIYRLAKISIYAEISTNSD